MYKKSKAGIWGIIITIVILILIVIFSNGERNTSFFESVANKLVMPIQNGLTFLKNKINGNDTFFADINNLKQENEDIIGWIQIDNTLIDYPVLQATDNNYYLTRNYKKEKSKYGSIFAKSECDIKNNNSNVIIYGHNMKDEQMFNTLLKYENKNFYDEHKEIKIATESEESKYSIISVFKSRVFYQDEKDVFRYYNYTKFDNEEEYNTFIKKCKEIQLYDTGVSAQYGEQLVTLITCEYSQVNGRMIVVAKKES